MTKDKRSSVREIEPFDEYEFKQFLQHYLPDVRFTSQTALKQFHQITSGIPYNLQLIGSEIQQEGLKDLDSEKITRIVHTLLQKEGELSFKEFVDDLTPSEVRVLRALSRFPDIKPSEIAAQQFMDKDTVGYSLNLLIGKGIILRKERGLYRMTDNLFGEWLKVDEES